MAVNHKSCAYSEYNSPLQLFRCSYEGNCSDKINAGNCFNCARAVIKSREELLEYECEAESHKHRIRENLPKIEMFSLAKSRGF